MTPAPRPFTSGIRRSGRTAVIDLHGEIDARADAAIHAAFEEALAADPDVVLLNFGDVDYLNSTGIALVVGLLARSLKDGRQLLAFGLNDHYRELFRITRLADYVGLFRDEASALAGVASDLR